MYSKVENISSVVSKKSEKIFFDPYNYGHHEKRLKNRSFSDFFETMLEMFSILKYIGQLEILAEKNYLRFFRQVRKFKKST